MSYLLLLPDTQQRKRGSIYSGSQCEGMQSLMPPRSIKGLVSLCPQEKAENRQTGREADDKTQRPALSPCNSNLPPSSEGRPVVFTAFQNSIITWRPVFKPMSRWGWGTGHFTFKSQQNDMENKTSN